MPRDNDPIGNYNFIIEIDGIGVAGFAKMSGLKNETEIIEYRDGSDITSVRKLPGLTKFGDVTLKRGVTRSNDLWNWRKSVIDGQLQRRSISVVLLDEARQEAKRWNLFEAWPAKWTGPELNGKGNDVAIEELVLACERIELG